MKKKLMAERLDRLRKKLAQRPPCHHYYIELINGSGVLVGDRPAVIAPGQSYEFPMQDGCRLRILTQRRG